MAGKTCNTELMEQPLHSTNYASETPKPRISDPPLIFYGRFLNYLTYNVYQSECLQIHVLSGAVSRAHRLHSIKSQAICLVCLPNRRTLSANRTHRTRFDTTSYWHILQYGQAQRFKFIWAVLFKPFEMVLELMISAHTEKSKPQALKRKRT